MINIFLNFISRGYEYAEMVTPRKKVLTILGLGHTIGTPSGGLEAPAIVVRNYTELQARAEEVKLLFTIYIFFIFDFKAKIKTKL